MRLTLRTLLAYLDDILDPADKEELAQKIESSDFAKDLVHQTRDSVRRLRLSAPQVVGTGMGMDPNSVAEYLDNVLPPEQVGDYERICLESPLHLAETAACHHVLTMVLGEPADVDPRSRQRMYMIPSEARDRRRLRAEPAHARHMATPPAAAPVSAAAAASAASSIRQPTTNTYEVPEYLRARPWWQSRGALAALAAVLVVGTAFYFLSGMMGWFGPSRDVALANADAESAPIEVEAADPQIEIGTSETTTGSADTDITNAEPAAPAGVDSTVTPASPANTTATQPGLAVPPPLSAPELGNTQAADSAAGAPIPNPATIAAVEPTTGTGETSSTAPDASAPASTSPAPVENSAASAVAPPSETAVPQDTTSTVPAPSANATAAIPPQDGTLIPPQTEAVPPATSTAAVPTNPDQPTAETAEAGTVGAPVDGAVGTATESVPAGPPEVGTYLSGKTVLLRHDEQSGAWFRMEPRSGVIAGQRLLALPEFRPQITLDSGMMLELSGGTQAMLNVGEASTTIEVLYGRVILINTANTENTVELKLGSHTGKVQLARNATLGVELERQIVPGTDPRSAPAQVLVQLFAPEGGVMWSDAAGEIAAEGPSRWTLVEGAAAELVADQAPPDWLNKEPGSNSSEQRYGAPVLDNTLVSDRPVDIQLLELYKESPRKEVKALATRSSIHVGLFAPFIDALRDSSQKMPTWRSHIETLRSAMARSPETAESVFQALVEQRGRAPATDLYEMLCGYNIEQVGKTPDEMPNGAVARLIEWLEEDSLDYRVLAVVNLQEITNKQLMPNPAATATVRKQNVRRWRDRLESGDLQFVERRPEE